MVNVNKSLAVISWSFFLVNVCQLKAIKEWCHCFKYFLSIHPFLSYRVLMLRKMRKTKNLLQMVVLLILTIKCPEDQRRL